MKITIYELLGLVKYGKTPKKIRYNNEIWKYDNENKDYISFTDDGKYYNLLFNTIDFLEKLNDKVEIIEEPKKIEKILISMDDNSMSFVGNSQYKHLSYSEIDLMMATKINELIDEINKLKEND